MEDFARQARATGPSWIEWARRVSGGLGFSDFVGEIAGPETERGRDSDRAALIGTFVQAAAENPEGFARMFGPAFGSDLDDPAPAATNPLVPSGFSALANLVDNGVCDDWELFVRWTEGGYKVVPWRDRTEADARLGPSQAWRMLGLLTGGARPAPGEADEAAWVQEACGSPELASDRAARRSPGRSGR